MTIVDIAKEAGYSVSTVSRVLNGRRDVSEEARDRIMRIVEAYQFVPNNNAKHLKQTVSQSILILVKGTSNMLFTNIIEVIQDTIEGSDYSLRVHYLDEDADEVKEAVRMCREHKPMGILFLGGNIQYFHEEFELVNVPCVLVTDRADKLGFRNLASVSTDDMAAAEMAVDYLFDHGHRDIAVIGGDMALSSPSKYRKAGAKRSFIKHGCEFEEESYAVARLSAYFSFSLTLHASIASSPCSPNAFAAGPKLPHLRNTGVIICFPFSISAISMPMLFPSAWIPRISSLVLGPQTTSTRGTMWAGAIQWAMTVRSCLPSGTSSKMLR